MTKVRVQQNCLFVWFKIKSEQLLEFFKQCNKVHLVDWSGAGWIYFFGRGNLSSQKDNVEKYTKTYELVSWNLIEKFFLSKRKIDSRERLDWSDKFFRYCDVTRLVTWTERKRKYIRKRFLSWIIIVKTVWEMCSLYKENRK